jgi:hypothetical protein
MKDIFLTFALFIVALLFLGMFLTIGVDMWETGFCRLQGRTNMWCYEQVEGMPHWSTNEFVFPITSLRE